VPRENDVNRKEEGEQRRRNEDPVGAWRREGQNE